MPPPRLAHQLSASVPYMPVHGAVKPVQPHLLCMMVYHVLPALLLSKLYFRHCARINSSNSCLKEKLLVINIPKQQFEKQTQIVLMYEQTPLKISVFSGSQNRTIPDGAKRTETTRTDYEDVEPESWKQFAS